MYEKLTKLIHMQKIGTKNRIRRRLFRMKSSRRGILILADDVRSDDIQMVSNRSVNG